MANDSDDSSVLSSAPSEPEQGVILENEKGKSSRKRVAAKTGEEAGYVKRVRRSAVEPKTGKSKQTVFNGEVQREAEIKDCLLYTSPSPRDGLLSRMPSSA